jgi:hypothetical protein
MARNALILPLLVVSIVLGTTLVRVQNYRYALWLRMCPNMRESVGAWGIILGKRRLTTAKRLSTPEQTNGRLRWKQPLSRLRSLPSALACC